MFDLIGKGLTAIHEGPAKKPDLDLDALEKLAAQATPGPWEAIITPGWDEFLHTIRGDDGVFLFDLHNARNGAANAAYIVAACNAVPELIAENRALRAKVQMMDWQMVWLAKQVCDSLSPQEWINRAEQAFKEAGE